MTNPELRRYPMFVLPKRTTGYLQIFSTSNADSVIPQPLEMEKQLCLHSACKNLRDIYLRSLQFRNPAQYLGRVLFLQEKDPSP